MIGIQFGCTGALKKLFGSTGEKLSLTQVRVPTPHARALVRALATSTCCSIYTGIKPNCTATPCRHLGHV
jgi:hypothetical protein